MSDINTPEATAPPEVAPVSAPEAPVEAPAVEVTALGLAQVAAIDEAARASQAADAAHVNVVVDSTHHIGTSLLHHTTTYVEHVERGVTRIEQIVGR